MLSPFSPFPIDAVHSCLSAVRGNMVSKDGEVHGEKVRKQGTETDDGN